MILWRPGGQKPTDTIAECVCSICNEWFSCQDSVGLQNNPFTCWMLRGGILKSRRPIHEDIIATFPCQCPMHYKIFKNLICDRLNTIYPTSLWIILPHFPSPAVASCLLRRSNLNRKERALFKTRGKTAIVIWFVVSTFSQNGDRPFFL